MSENEVWGQKYSLLQSWVSKKEIKPYSLRRWLANLGLKCNLWQKVEGTEL